MAKSETQYWLAEVSGFPKFKDGPHDDRAGVEKALYLFNSLGLGEPGEKYVCAKVILTDVDPKPHGANEEAIAWNNHVASVVGRRQSGITYPPAFPDQSKIQPRKGE